MNQASEQLTAEYNIVVADDQPLSPKGLKEALLRNLHGHAAIAEFFDKKVVAGTFGGRNTILLCKAVTYLGNPHPIFKKRIQIPKEWIDYARRATEADWDVRFIGVYNYEGFTVYVDFDKETYLRHSCNNSAAHVYINDLYQGSIYDIFEKTDRNGNHISVVSSNFLLAYLNGERKHNHLFGLFSRFNRETHFGQWLSAMDAIPEMHGQGWSQWRQTEWPGWFLEYKFSQFAQGHDVAPFIEYTALSYKGKKGDGFDFDIWFPADMFYGDLKASDVEKTETPGNDQEAFVNCIKRYGKFWYVIYEHKTIKDAERNYEATRFRNHYIKNADNLADENFDELSYHRRMKHSVKFVGMCILELNRINYHSLLAAFNQGHQPDGSARKPKFLIKKKDIDNFVVYRYRFENGSEQI